MNYYKFGTITDDAYGIDWIRANADVEVYDSALSQDLTYSIVKTVGTSISGIESSEEEYLNLRNRAGI